MRESLRGAVVRRRRVRALARGALALVFVTGAVWFWGPMGSRASSRGEAGIAHDLSPSLIETVTDDAAVLDRYTIRIELDPSVFLRNDDELLEHLERAGHATGLLRVGAELMLTEGLGE